MATVRHVKRRIVCPIGFQISNSSTNIRIGINRPQLTPRYRRKLLYKDISVIFEMVRPAFNKTGDSARIEGVDRFIDFYVPIVHTIFKSTGISRRNITSNPPNIPTNIRSNHKGIIIERIDASRTGAILDRTQHIAHNAADIHTCMHGATHNIGIKDVRPFFFAIPNHVANNAARIPHCPDIGVIDIHILN